LGVSSGRAETDTFIQAAHPIPLQIDRDVLVADGAKLADDSSTKVGIERPVQFVRAELDTCERIVMANAAHAETKIPQGSFRTLDHPQLFGGHL
jgi:hypothetical protein